MGRARNLALLGGLAAALAVAVRGRVRHPVRRFNHAVLNPLMLRLAGRPGFYASALHHVGRRSGRAYVTPVVAEPTADGFVIPLPYGVDTDWCWNVRAAGAATLVVGGRTYPVDAPRVAPASEVLPLLRPGRRFTHRRLGTERFLLLRKADAPPPPPPVKD